MLCYLCGGHIRHDLNTGVEVCPECAMHYCAECAPAVTTCYVCGAKPVEAQTREIEELDLAEIFAELAGVEKRRQRRTSVRLECAYTFEDRDSDDEKKHRALTRDVSKSGLCIYSRTPLETGERVSFRTCQAFRSRKTAVVRWVRQNERGTYVAGLSFERTLPEETSAAGEGSREETAPDVVERRDGGGPERPARSSQKER